ncbi:aquaporin family protein [Mesorhizobium loti]|nr:MIP/aquaporin family protein [Mesorhizobium loti]PLP59965.1 aquaporin family protein [Mesorhizobium loti]
MPLHTRLVAEALATALLLATVIGSTIMGTTLAPDNPAFALFVTSTSTGGMLFVLISAFGPVSGAHINPVVSLGLAATGDFAWRECLPYIVAQIIGAVIGIWMAHAMFEQPMLQLSATARDSAGMWLSEAVATFGLLLVVLSCAARKPTAIAAAVGLYIAAAYWFTASSSFANPAMTLARAFTATAAGIRLADVAGWIAAQCLGAVAAYLAARLFWPKVTVPSELPAAEFQRTPA